MAQRRNWRIVLTVAPLLAALGVMVTLVSYSPTLYRIFCNATGFAGTVKRADASAAKPAIADSNHTITVHFDSNVAPGLDWSFKPMQREVTVKLGVPTQIFYTATNHSDKPIIARAVYNITPYQVAPFFYKIQCFCFTNEKLGPGETAKMPVVFFIDKAAASDPDAQIMSDVTLSYTFYDQSRFKPLLSAARDRADGSKNETAKIDKKAPSSNSASFQNDAPRR
jgi:cytochrome c oxidase assembly protein subunit 11